MNKEAEIMPGIMKIFGITVWIRIAFIIVILFLSSSCAKDKDKNISVEMSYTEAMKVLKDKRYAEAAEKFEKITDDYPLSKWSIRAGTMAAYAFYKDEKYDEVIKVTDDFIRSNPANDAVPYMQYLKALSYYDLIPNIQRAQNNTQMASYAFRELIARFPNSEYADDAKKKLVIVDEHLAGARMSIGRYSVKTENYVGAIENFMDVIYRYRNTNQVPEAYYRLAAVYSKIGMNSQAQKFVSILQKNYPRNEWTNRVNTLMIN